MDYLYKKPKNEIIVPAELPATIVTADKKDAQITFISQEEYLRDIETMCQRDKWFMETIRGFCDKVVEVHVEQPIPSDQSASVSEEGSE